MQKIEPRVVTELVAATRDVFRTMVFQDVEEALVEDEMLPPRRIVGCVAFDGGDTGLVAFSTSVETACAITASMLMMEEAHVDAELQDAIGELTNMIAGSFRTRMVDLRERDVLEEVGGSWTISVPTVTVGDDFSITYVREAQRALCPFRMGTRDILIELIVTRRTP